MLHGISVLVVYELSLPSPFLFPQGSMWYLKLSISRFLVVFTFNKAILISVRYRSEGAGDGVSIDLLVPLTYTKL